MVRNLLGIFRRSEIDKVLPLLKIESSDPSYQALREILKEYEAASQQYLHFGFNKQQRQDILKDAGLLVSESFDKYGIENVQNILAKLNPNERGHIGHVLSSLKKYGIERVQEVLDYGYFPMEHIDDICPIFEKLRAVREEGGESLQFRLKFYGYVQGVGFRDTIHWYAGMYGLHCHYAKNLPDGTVEADVEATEPFLQLLLTTLKEKFEIEKIDIIR